MVNRKDRQTAMPGIGLCESCGTDIKGRYRSARYCSSSCKSKASYARNAETKKARKRERYATDPHYRHLIRIHKTAAAEVPDLGLCGCGAPAVDRHHDDITRPEEVRLLCRPCHRNWHLENPGKEREVHNAIVSG